MVDWLKLFQEIADEIRQDVKPFFGSEKAREDMGRGAGGDTTKYVDFLAEEIVVRTLEAGEVPCTLISEECGTRRIGRGGADYVVLDGIDGTTNSTRNIPFVSTSIARSTGNRLGDVDVALVKDLYRDLDYTAIRGKGAFEEGKPLHVSNINSLERAIVAVNLTPRERLPGQINRISPVLFKALKFRQLGSTALEVCYVATGALDAFIDVEGLARATDLAAANLILKEAGGITVTSLGEELDMPLRTSARLPFVSAANKTLCSEILSYLK